MALTNAHDFTTCLQQPLFRGCFVPSVDAVRGLPRFQREGRSLAFEIAIGPISRAVFHVIVARLDNYAGEFIVNVDVKVVLV